MSKYRPAGVALALVFMAFFLAALGARLWASGKAVEIVGPDHIAADGEHVYVHDNGELFVRSRARRYSCERCVAGLLHGAA